MKAMDVIDRLDLMEPNQYSPEQKLHWLSSLDGKTYAEVIDPKGFSRVGFIPYETGKEELLIEFPYGEDIYYYYLQAMIAAENSETQRYNKRMTMFNNSYSEWQNWFNRTHQPCRAADGFVF